MMFDKYLKDYGFTDHHLKQLPQIQRMLSLWRMASGYVNKYVDAVYSEFDISQDCYIKQWFQELNSGTYKGFAGHLEDVTLEKVKQVFTIHIFQSLVHWSDHNITLNYLSGVDSTLGYDKSSQGLATSSDKMLSNYILLIANTSKLMGDKDNYPKLMDIGYIPFLENHALMANLTSLKHELVDFEAHELKVNNYRDALLLSDMYQGASPSDRTPITRPSASLSTIPSAPCSASITPSSWCAISVTSLRPVACTPPGKDAPPTPEIKQPAAYDDSAW